MIYDIIIVGAGPAGLTAALYAKRANKKVLVFEALTYGGQLANISKIDNYPSNPHISGIDLATNLYNQVKELDTEIIFEKVININNFDNYKEVVTESNTYQTKTIILATGNYSKKLNLPNEEKFIGRGISYCATCDGNFFKDKDVSVVGDNDTTIEDCLYLSDICKNVYLITNKDKLDNNKLKEKDNIKILFNSKINKLVGDKYLEGIETNSETIDVSGLFVSLGRIPENENFKKLIELDKFGYIKANELCHTNVSGIFAAGDNRVKSLRQIVTATSDGAIAATEAIKYLNE